MCLPVPVVRPQVGGWEGAGASGQVDAQVKSPVVERWVRSGPSSTYSQAGNIGIIYKTIYITIYN